jgi:hypothetical protein
MRLSKVVLPAPRNPVRMMTEALAEDAGSALLICSMSLTDAEA